MSRPEVVVVGGGVVGLATARALADRGLRTVVLERHRPGMEASWAAAGMLAPLAEMPTAGPFFDACRASRDRWLGYASELAAESGVDLDHDESGALLIDRPEVLERFAAAAAALGEPVEPVDRTRLRALLPEAAVAIDRALLLAGEHRVDNRAVCRALEIALARRGVAVLCGREATVVEGSDGGVALVGDGWQIEADAAVIAAGAWSGRIAGLPPLAVRPVHGDVLAYGDLDPTWRGSVRSADVYAVARAGGGVVVGATAADLGFRPHVTEEGQARLRGSAARLFPALEGRRPVASWSGLRPGTPDDQPVIGRLAGALWAATGHYRNGILLAPWSAETLAAAIAGDATAERALAPFAADRAALAAAAGRA